MKEALCRPDEFHWCVECCPPDCPLLGDTGGGRIGCLGHNGKETVDGLTERSICLELDCLADFDGEDRETIRQAILKLPLGQFKMSEVLSKFIIGERICAWCSKSLGKKIGIDGITHGICEKCEAVEEERYKQSKSDSK
jgi:hypothetical protein